MDVQLSEAGRKVFPYAVECKNTKTTSIGAWLKQAEANSEGLEPVVVFRIPPSTKSYVVLDFDVFLELSKPQLDYSRICSGDESVIDVTVWEEGLLSTCN